MEYAVRAQPNLPMYMRGLPGPAPLSLRQGRAKIELKESFSQAHHEGRKPLKSLKRNPTPEQPPKTRAVSPAPSRTSDSLCLVPRGLRAHTSYDTIPLAPNSISTCMLAEARAKARITVGTGKGHSRTPCTTGTNVRA